MDRLPFADFDSSAVSCQPLLVELPRSRVLSRNELNGVIRSKHPRQTDRHSLKPRVKHDRVLSGVVRDDSVHGQRQVHEPPFSDGMERTPAHTYFRVAHCQPNLGSDVSPGTHEA